jgi:two-component sensor histidine kinase
MLHEIYHRVKNNLQIIVSLLQLQASSTDNPEVLDVLSESHRRVMTIANIQNQLYEGSDLTKISLGDFIYKLVVSCDPDQKPLGQVDLKIQMDSIAGEATKLNQAVSIDTAVPLGLVLSELLSNCYRHAFPDGRSGTIEVRGRRTDRDEIVVEIQDDGVGIAPEDRRPKGLGLVLAEILAAQINGTVDIQSPASGGTLCTLIFL